MHKYAYSGWTDKLFFGIEPGILSTRLKGRVFLYKIYFRDIVPPFQRYLNVYTKQ
jgi:hypothetical protein